MPEVFCEKHPTKKMYPDRKYNLWCYDCQAELLQEKMVAMSPAEREKLVALCRSELSSMSVGYKRNVG